MTDACTGAPFFSQPPQATRLTRLHTFAYGRNILQNAKTGPDSDGGAGGCDNVPLVISDADPLQVSVFQRILGLER